MAPKQDISTIGDLQSLLEGLPPDQPLQAFQIDKERFIVLVDSEGKARKQVTTERSVLIMFELPKND